MKTEKFYVKCPYCPQEYYGKSPEDVASKLFQHLVGVFMYVSSPSTKPRKDRRRHSPLREMFEPSPNYERVKPYLLSLVKEH